MVQDIGGDMGCFVERRMEVGIGRVDGGVDGCVVGICEYGPRPEK